MLDVVHLSSVIMEQPDDHVQGDLADRPGPGVIVFGLR